MGFFSFLCLHQPLYYLWNIIYIMNVWVQRQLVSSFYCFSFTSFFFFFCLLELVCILCVHILYIYHLSCLFCVCGWGGIALILTSDKVAIDAAASAMSLSSTPCRTTTARSAFSLQSCTAALLTALWGAGRGRDAWPIGHLSLQNCQEQKAF